MKKRLFSALGFLMLCIGMTAQITLIDPAGDGGFETGATFAANSWSVAQTQTTRVWYAGTGQTGFTGTRSAFIGNSATTVGTTTAARTAHLFKSVTIPTGAVNIVLSFKYKQAVADSNYDYLTVFLNNNVPVSGTAQTTGSLVTINPGTMTVANYTTYAVVTVTVPNAYAGSTNNLIFTFNADGVSPHAYGAIDDVSLTYVLPSCFAPTALNTSAVLPTSANFTWTAGASETAWDVYYGTTPLAVPNATTVPTATTAATSYSATGLSSNTGYAVYVRANCGGGDLSVWSPVKTFTTLMPACSGAPAAGTTTSTATGPICSGTSFTLSLSGATTGVSGLTYQWQYSPDGTTWTSVPSATLSTAVVSTQTATTYYQAIVTCGASSSTSTPVQVTQNNFMSCYCITTPGTVNAVDIVTSVKIANTLGAVFTNTSTSNGSTNFDSYNNTPIDLVRGTTTNTLTIIYGTDGTQYGAAWIDFNRNGIYETSENILLLSTAAGGSGTTTVTFTVPAGASLGNTRIRVRGGSDAAYTAAGACTSSSYGETEDYIVNIIIQPTCFVPTGLTTSNPTTGSIDLSWTAPALGTPVSYVYEIRTSGAAGSGATGLVTTGTVTAPSTSVTVSGLSTLTTYSAYIVTDCGAGDMSAWSAAKSFTTQASCPVPTALNSTVTSTSATYTWVAGGAETAWDVYYGSQPLTVPGATTVPTATTSVASYTASGLTPSSAYSFYVRANCGAGSTSIWTAVSNFTTPCLAPNVINPMGSVRCGIGSTTISATADMGGTINWYSGPTGGTAIATGTLFTTPSLTNTTSYYASAIGGLTIENAGKPAATNSSGFLTTPDWGIQFSTTKQVLINSVTIFPVGSGSVTIAVVNASGTELMASPSMAVAGTGSNTPVVLNLGFTVPQGTGYRMVLKNYSGITDLIRDGSPNAFPYTSASGALSVTAGWNGSASASYYWFYNLNISTGCESARTMITASVTTAPAFSLNAPASVCSTSGVATLSVTSTLSDYDSYTWSPVANLYTDASATNAYTGGNSSLVYINSPVSGVATVSATANNSTSGCIAYATTTVMINHTPATPTVAASVASGCLGSPVSFTATSSAPMAAIFSDNFNGAPVMTAVNNGGTASTIFTNEPDGYVTTGTSTYTWHPTTNTSFMLANSDGGGSGSSTNTELVSPVINTTGYTALTLKYNHHIKHYGTSVGTVEVSTDGGSTWTVVTTYTADIGTSTSFQPASIPLNSYINQPNFKFKFKFAAAWSWFWGIDDVSLEAPVNPNYAWAGSSVDAGVPVAATTPAATNKTVTVLPATTGVHTYSVTVYEGTCSSTSSTSITVNAIPTVTAAASSSSVCAGTSATLTAGGATNYTWTAGGNTSTQVVTPGSTSVYTVTGETSGCSNTATVSLDVTPGPTVTATASQTLLCDDGSTGSSILTATSNGSSYLWSDGAMTMTTSVTPLTTTVYTVTVTEMGCSTDAFVTITVSNCTGVKEASLSNGISLYPNPTNGIVNVSISSELSGTTSVEIYDAIGKLVIRETLNKDVTTIHTTKLEDGIYMFKIINNNKAIKVGRLIKQ